MSSELTELAAGGWLRDRGNGGAPSMPGTLCAQYGAGLFGAVGVVLALRARRRFGFGQLVETPMNEALLSLLAFPTALAAMSGADFGRLGESYPFAIYPCADGHLGVSILTQRHWDGLCRLLGREDLLTTPGFRTGVERAQPDMVPRIDLIIGDWLAGQPAQETFERAQALRVPVAIVPSPSQVLASPQYADRGYWQDYDDPELGELRLPGEPFKYGSGGFAPFRAAASFGADTVATLEAIGTPSEETIALSRMGVV